jgi:DNA polymerase-3 subunit epsilon
MRGLIRRLLAAPFRTPPREFLHHRAREHAAPPERPLAAGRHVVFDLETTGLKPTAGDAIVAIGAVAIEEGAVVDRFVTLAHPGRSIPATASRWHGITDADVAGAPPVAEAVAAFQAFLGRGALLVAHNAAFDLTALHMAELNASAPAIVAPVLCSLLTSRWLDPVLDDHSLDAACARHDIPQPRRHDALADAEATAALWQRLLDRAARRGIASPAELARRAGMARGILQQMERF